MRNLWYSGNYRTNNGILFDQVNAELEKHFGSRYENEDIDIFGDVYGDFELINYRSRELIMARYKGTTYSTEEELAEYEKTWSS